MNYGRPLFNILRKSIDYPKGKLIAFNIEAREARALLKRFSKKDGGGMVYFELVPSPVDRIGRLTRVTWLSGDPRAIPVDYVAN